MTPHYGLRITERAGRSCPDYNTHIQVLLDVVGKVVHSTRIQYFADTVSFQWVLFAVRNAVAFAPVLYRTSLEGLPLSEVYATLKIDHCNPLIFVFFFFFLGVATTTTNITTGY